MCIACSFNAWGTLTVTAVCVNPRKKQFGKSAVCIPCKVRGPFPHFSLSCCPFRPKMSYPARRVYPVPTSNPVANTMQSTSYSTPPATTPFSVMRSTPLPSVSTRVTLGKLKVGRYSSWKQGLLQNCRYQGFKASAVAGSSTTWSTRSRIEFIFW